MTEVVLLDAQGQPIGAIEKLAAHRDGGKLHLAFSVVLLRGKTMLITRRSPKKPGCPGRWSNTVCSHPEPGEEIRAAAMRRLREELGIEGVEVEERFCLCYHAQLSESFWEYEDTHVFVGYADPGLVVLPNPEEVIGCRWVEMEALKKDVQANPDQYTPWFRLILERLEEVGK